MIEVNFFSKLESMSSYSHRRKLQSSTLLTDWPLFVFVACPYANEIL